MRRWRMIAPAIALVAVLSCSDDTTSETSSSATSTTSTDVAAAAAGGDVLEFRPVSSPVDCGPDVGHDSSVFPSQDGTICYQLGPVGFTGEALSEAEATFDSGWSVEVTVADDAREEANELFDACFRGQLECPNLSGTGGTVAIVLDGVVISAPAVQAPGLADSPFVISGSFTESEAKALARTLG